MTKWVHEFSQGRADGSAAMAELLGEKGAGLAEMAALGLAVPPGFTIAAPACAHFLARQNLPADLEAQVDAALARLRELVEPTRPLLVSVRPGACVPLPGVMETLLNLGLDQESVETLARFSGDEGFAHDRHRRFIEAYATAVLGVEPSEFEEALESYKAQKGFELDAELLASDWRAAAAICRQVVARATGRPFPETLHDQLFEAIRAAFASWASPRAKAYRELHRIPESVGLAVTVQAMTFADIGEGSGRGTASTRNSGSGAPGLGGEFLLAGEDQRAARSLTEAARLAAQLDKPSMEAALPDAFHELACAAELLESRYRDMLDVEFALERGKLWMLEARTGKRSARAALKIAVDMANEGLIAREDAILRVDPLSFDQLLHQTIEPSAARAVLATGMPASPGAAAGEIVFDAQEAAKLASVGRKVILVRAETSPEDVTGMHAAQGILTSRGGLTSHAAMVARGMGKPCVTGAAAIRVDYLSQSFTVAGRRFGKGEQITIDGSAGQVIAGVVAMRQPLLTGEFAVLMGWADKARRLRVRANADTAKDARAARRFGAEGIGLARTEHMFFEEGRIVAMREMILADDAQGRRAALAKLLPMQREDVKELFEIMSGLPVTIRLLDPPLHEFLPNTDEEIASVARAMGADPEKLRQRARALSEFNPMLGFRGVRLAVAFPEIVDMQARAIFEAAIEAMATTGAPVEAEIMVPLVFSKAELDRVGARIVKTAQEIEQETGVSPRYKIGAMIELPRAALRAGEIAGTAEFFSFGTNDLTQTALGISRDDASAYLGVYTASGILSADPFSAIDQEGVGELVEIAAKRARASRSSIALGVCGEHGGDPASVAFFEEIGLDYVSCSPYRVPIARLAAAQAALRKTR